MAAAPAAQQITLDGRVLWNGIRQASACSEEPILGIARGHTLTLVALSGARLVISWHFRLPAAARGLTVFGIPPMIVSHLITTPAEKVTTVHLILKGNDVSLSTHDEVGRYELRWRFDPRQFPAPPEMGQLLTLPATLLPMNYLQLSDAIHRAVAKLVDIESRYCIHRTKLAVLLGLSRGQLVVDGQEVSTRIMGRYYFDPRLIVRALEFVHADQVEIGLTSLSPRRAIFSIVERRPDRLTHCALLSIGLDTMRLFPPTSRTNW